MTIQPDQILTLNAGGFTLHRVVAGDLAGLTLKEGVKDGFKAVEITHDRIDGFVARAVVGEAVSPEWVIEQLVNTVKLAF